MKAERFALVLVALNAPFALCHPGCSAVEWPPLRALVVGAVLLIVPGLPWMALLVTRRPPHSFSWLWTVVLSLAALPVVVCCVHVLGLPLTGSAAWNGVWLLTNVGVLLNILLPGRPGLGIRLNHRATWIGAALFLAAFGLFYCGATRVVPPMEDQDFDVLGCGYGLLERFEPLLVSDHDTVYQFAHPPAAYLCAAGSFLYFDRLDYLADYDAASQRARDARRGVAFEPFDGTVEGLSKGVGQHRVVGVEGADYLVDPPLVDGSRKIPVWLLENGVLAQYYQRDPQLLAARTPNVFLAALTVALLACWIARMTGNWPLGVLIAAAYATGPEVFVRSSYGGHFAGSNFAALLVLLAVEAQPLRSRRAAWLACLAAGGLLALVNHKLILLPMAIVVWKLLCGKETRITLRMARSLLHPVALGFAAGTALFWLWGLSVAPAEFWHDHLQTHYLARITHHNPLGYGGYPSVAGLWLELCRHTGYLLLPLAVVTLGLGVWRNAPARCSPSRPPPDTQCSQGEAAEDSLVLWLIWTVLTAVAFSLVDWRQTKHLMPLMLAFHLAPARWAANRRTRLLLVAAVFALLLAWNLWALTTLVADFKSFPVTPRW